MDRRGTSWNGDIDQECVGQIRRTLVSVAKLLPSHIAAHGPVLVAHKQAAAHGSGRRWRGRGRCASSAACGRLEREAVRKLGVALRGPFRTWQRGVLCGSVGLKAALELRVTRELKLDNGGIPVTLALADAEPA